MIQYGKMQAHCCNGLHHNKFLISNIIFVYVSFNVCVVFICSKHTAPVTGYCEVFERHFIDLCFLIDRITFF